MSEHTNVALHRKVHEAFSRGDMDTLTEMIAEDVVWHSPGKSQISGDFRGREAVEGGSSKRVFNVVDVYPVCDEELYRYIAAMVNGPEPKTGGERFLPSLNCKNEAIKSALGWKPAFPSFRSGLAE